MVFMKPNMNFKMLGFALLFPTYGAVCMKLLSNIGKQVWI